jgi:Bacterial archaeo-eukaryotic release factor family 11
MPNWRRRGLWPKNTAYYLPTTPLTQKTKGSRIELRNRIDEAVSQLRDIGLDKRRLTALRAQLNELVDDDHFWKFQANSLAVLATPDTMRTFRLPNKLASILEVSDRFHLKPLLRAITFPHEAFVLALSENATRLVEVFADLPPQKIKFRDLPKSAADSVKRASLSERSPERRIQGSEGQKVLLRKFARQVDAALRPVLSGRETPLILAAAEPLASIYRSVCTYPSLSQRVIRGSPNHMTEAELATAAREILDGIYANEVQTIKALFETRKGVALATTDMSDAARAATLGAIESLLVDIDEVIPGFVDENTGRVTFTKEADAKSYGVVDEIAGRALLTGARVLGVRKDDIPERAHLAAILRYAI